MSHKWVCPSWLNSVGTFSLCDSSSFCSSHCYQGRSSVKSTNVPSRHDSPPLTFCHRAGLELSLSICSVNREPSGLLVALELKDPPAFRGCLENEEVLASLDPRETESVWRDDFLTLNTKTSGLSFDCSGFFFCPFPIVVGWHWRKRTRGCPR